MVSNINKFLITTYYNNLDKILSKYKNKEIIFFCVGNYKIWYDSFAPIFAEFVRNLSFNNYFVYGGKNFSITAENLQEYMEFVENKHPNACIIVIDNCITLNRIDNGKILIKERSCTPAGLTNDRLFGSISVLLYTYINQDPNEFLNIQSNVLLNLLETINKLLIKYSKTAKIANFI